MNTFSMRYDPDLIPDNKRRGFLFQKRSKKMNNEKKQNILNWLNFGTAIIGVLVKVVKEIIDLIPTKETK